jgi:hypothetical protein
MGSPGAGIIGYPVHLLVMSWSFLLLFLPQAGKLLLKRGKDILHVLH